MNSGGIYPYYEQGEGVDPIGTSDLFYVRLKDNDKESLEKMAEKYGVKIVEEVPYMPECNNPYNRPFEFSLGNDKFVRSLFR